jgi:DNA repair protein RecO (recombination protein O)
MATNKSDRRGAEPLEAYILQSHDWSESSLILEVLTRQLGRLTIAAKGAKRPYSQLRSVLRPFQRIKVQLNRRPTLTSHTQIDGLRHAEWVGSSAIVMGDRLFSGFYLNELLLKFVPHEDPHHQLFDAYAATLHELPAANSESDLQALLRAFEFRLLREMGYLPDLSLETLTHQPIISDKLYGLQADCGLTADKSHTSETLGSGITLLGSFWLELEAALQHGSMLALKTACMSSLPIVKIISRALIQAHLGRYPIYSRDVYADIVHFHEINRSSL